MFVCGCVCVCVYHTHTDPLYRIAILILILYTCTCTHLTFNPYGHTLYHIPMLTHSISFSYTDHLEITILLG